MTIELSKEDTLADVKNVEAEVERLRKQDFLRRRNRSDDDED